MGGRAPSRKSTRKNIHQKIINVRYLLGLIPILHGFLKGGGLNTAVGAGTGTIPSGPSHHVFLGFFLDDQGLTGEVRLKITPLCP